MNPVSLKEAKRLFRKTRRASKENVKVVVCPPFIHLSSLVNKRVSIGAQDTHFNDSGAHTGEISPTMLKDLGVEYVILGHSELGEDRDLVDRKVQASVRAGLKPIVCVPSIMESYPSNCIIAYEPVGAIGTGEVPSSEELKNILDKIRDTIGNSPILYGGSVDDNNVKEIISLGYDGVLVGGASLHPGKVRRMARRV